MRPRGSRTLRRPAHIVTPRDEAVYLAATGRAVRFVREESGISVRAIAQMLGLNPSELHRLEAGSKPRTGRSASQGPTLRTIIRIARALGVQPSELLP